MMSRWRPIIVMKGRLLFFDSLTKILVSVVTETFNLNIGMIRIILDT